MDERETGACTAFLNGNRLASGTPEDVSVACRAALAAAPHAEIRVFDDATARPVDFDLRGSTEEVRARHAAPPRRPGRPKLGVVAREVTLLPRHWEWLGAQRGGASVALRRLIDEARAESAAADRTRAAQEAAFRFLQAMAGDRPHFEEAIRALFASDAGRFAAQMAGWPEDITAYARKLASPALTPAAAPASRDPAM
ncbi:hypothetical protein GCM10008171_14980 [Methylopila jiangsuensis]|uniref:DUF2239 domain-containing protein n=1 Tax=Methylopila jiangsuensis TaxID=586230 RepID=A0A9W6JHP0_9HYPH|nr:DUF2239 family protein [Methylopila jiangsuensis]MDR6284239.1 hypothetical protein [Methylopila jiangsuensis]GLK76244.1 hypothetical protein GCM10008171_14980 [Methylopila jiangsuensis]